MAQRQNLVSTAFQGLPRGEEPGKESGKDNPIRSPEAFSSRTAELKMIQ